MSRYHSYLNTAREILTLYNGEEPFASFLKKHFSQHKKFGSRDRKEIGNLCYSYFRLGKAARSNSKDNSDQPENSSDLEEKILAGLFFCSDKQNDILSELKPEWADNVALPVSEKILSLNFSLSSVFHWKNELNDGIDYEKFCVSFFVQPDLFLRIRPGKTEAVLLKLKESGIAYELATQSALRLPNNFKADLFFRLNDEVVVQDYSSQQVARFLPVTPGQAEHVWDCCAASGGKSIMAYDLNPSMQLVVSDIRESILANLKKRFSLAGIKKYSSYKADLAHLPFNTNHSPFDIIIADVPCTGSGTWSRTPEQLFYFDARKIDEFAVLQKKIVSNAILNLAPGGHLVYITCSVFKKENEEVVAFIKKQFHLQLVKMELLKGYEMKADTMFVALLQKQL